MHLAAAADNCGGEYAMAVGPRSGSIRLGHVRSRHLIPEALIPAGRAFEHGLTGAHGFGQVTVNLSQFDIVGEEVVGEVAAERDVY